MKIEFEITKFVNGNEASPYLVSKSFLSRFFMWVLEKKGDAKIGLITSLTTDPDEFPSDFGKINIHTIISNP